MDFRDSKLAFNDAIEQGRLSSNPATDNYAGNYMYMFTDDQGIDQFKHISTRRYLAAEHDRTA